MTKLNNRKNFSLYQDIQHIMGLHRAEIGMILIEDGAYTDRDIPIEEIKKHIEDIEAFIFHYEWNIGEAKLILKRYKDIMHKHGEVVV